MDNIWRLIRWLRGRGFIRPPEPPPVPDPPPTDSSLINEINSVRAAHRRKPLTLSDCLRYQATSHAEWMHKNNQMTHNGFRDRLAACDFRSGSENVAHGQRSVKEVVGDWMTSPGHRANILGDWDVCGGGETGTYWCVIFGA